MYSTKEKENKMQFGKDNTGFEYDFWKKELRKTYQVILSQHSYIRKVKAKQSWLCEIFTETGPEPRPLEKFN